MADGSFSCTESCIGITDKKRASALEHSLDLNDLRGCRIQLDTDADVREIEDELDAGLHHFRKDVGGVELHWAELGHGRPLVLLHGLADSHRTWLKIAPRLAKRRRVLMLDLPGHGLSGRPDAPYSLEWQANVVAQWLDELGLKEVDVVGHSYGGGVAMWMLLEHHDHVRRLALVASGGLGTEVGLGLRLASVPNLVEWVGQPLMGRCTRLALAYLDRPHRSAKEVEYLARMNSTPGTARAFSRCVRDVIDWRGQRRQLRHHVHALRRRVPVAVLWGEHDAVIPMTHSETARGLLAGCEIHAFPNCGHFPHWERPDAVVRVLERFLSPRSALTKPQLSHAVGRRYRNATGPRACGTFLPHA